MANSFCLNDTACRQIHAEGQMMRHFRNSLALTQPISVYRAASFPQHCAKDFSAGGIGRNSPGTRRTTRLFSFWFLQPSEYSG
jgi:adenine deaminase